MSSQIASEDILSKRILASAGNLNELGRLSVQQLMMFKGIGEAKAVAIAAALEIGRRRRGEDVKAISKITGSQDAFDLLFPILGELPHEEFWIVYLNNSNKILHKEQLSKGGITGTLVDVRLVLKQALEHGAVGLLLAHNHPSGDLSPSGEDLELTRRLLYVAQVLEIPLVDHLILGQGNHVSLRKLTELWQEFPQGD